MEIDQTGTFKTVNKFTLFHDRKNNGNPFSPFPVTKSQKIFNCQLPVKTLSLVLFLITVPLKMLLDGLNFPGGVVNS